MGVNRYINIIKNIFKISKCEYINHILGLNVRKNKFRYTISQENYIENILKKFNIKENEKASTPCTGDDIILINKTPFDKTIYESVVGCLIHVSNSTRLDIVFSVSKASRKNSNPTISDSVKILLISLNDFN